MPRRLFLLALLAVLPSMATAQRGGARTRSTEHDKMFSDDAPQGPTLRPRDIEDFSPIKLLIDKRKDLKLTDAQVDGLKKSEGALKDKNAPLLKAVDSLVHELKPPMNRTAESDAHLRDARIAFEQTLASIHENYDAATKEALAGFDADQQTRANEMLAAQEEEAAKRVREKMGAGDRGGRGG